MELGRGNNNKRWGQAIQTKVICHCRLEAKIRQAWTDKNPGRRFYGCELYPVKRLFLCTCWIRVFLCIISFLSQSGCKFFQWYDEGDAFGWQKQALIEARNEIRKKDKTIEELNKTIAGLRSELVKNEELEEDIINSFLKL